MMSPEYPMCPSQSGLLVEVQGEASAAMSAVGSSGEAGGSAEVRSVTTATLEVEIGEGSTLTAEEIAARFQEMLCQLRADPTATCTVTLLSSSKQSATRRLRSLQSSTAQVGLLQVEVAHDASSADAAQIDAALNDASQVSSLLLATDPGVRAAGISTQQTYANRVFVSANVPRTASSGSIEDIQGAVSAAVAASFGLDVSAARVTSASAVAMPPTFNITDLAAPAVTAASPPAAPPSSHSVDVTFTASGDLADYTPSVMSEIAATFAAEAGVALSAVAISVQPASVVVSVSIAAASATAASAVHAAIADDLATPAAATLFLSSVTGVAMSVESIDEPPTVVVVAPPGDGDVEEGSQDQVADGTTTGAAQASPLPAWVVAVLVGSGLICAFATLGLVMLAREKAASGDLVTSLSHKKAKPAKAVWPGKQPVGGTLPVVSVAGTSATSKPSSAGPTDPADPRFSKITLNANTGSVHIPAPSSAQPPLPQVSE